MPQSLTKFRGKSDDDLSSVYHDFQRGKFRRRGPKLFQPNEHTFSKSLLYSRTIIQVLGYQMRSALLSEWQSYSFTPKVKRVVLEGSNFNLELLRCVHLITLNEKWISTPIHQSLNIPFVLGSMSQNDAKPRSSIVLDNQHQCKIEISEKPS